MCLSGLKGMSSADLLCFSRAQTPHPERYSVFWEDKHHWCGFFQPEDTVWRIFEQLQRLASLLLHSLNCLLTGWLAALILLTHSLPSSGPPNMALGILVWGFVTGNSCRACCYGMRSLHQLLARNTQSPSRCSEVLHHKSWACIDLRGWSIWMWKLAKPFKRKSTIRSFNYHQLIIQVPSTTPSYLYTWSWRGISRCLTHRYGLYCC